MKKLLFLALVLLILFLSANSLSIKKKFSSVPKHENVNEYLISDSLKVLAYQITKSGTEVIYLASNGTSQNVYLWNEKTNNIVKLNSTGISTGIPYVSDEPYFAKSFMDVDGNVFFDSSGYLIRVSDNKEVEYYTYLDERLSHSVDELTDKTTSKLFKKIIDKYSTEQPAKLNMYDHLGLTTYLLDVDSGYYIVSKSNTLTLERFPLEGEDINTLVPNDHLKIRYGARWDSTLGKVKDKAVIETITATIKMEPKNISPAKTYKLELTNLMKRGKNYLIKNEAHTGKLQIFCYPNFFNIDGPSCKGERLFLKLKTKEYMLPNYKMGDENSNYASSFIYVPFDNRFITASGNFIFLSQHNGLYRFK